MEDFLAVEENQRASGMPTFCEVGLAKLGWFA
jgi:hypothetical protein